MLIHQWPTRNASIYGGAKSRSNAKTQAVVVSQIRNPKLEQRVRTLISGALPSISVQQGSYSAFQGKFSRIVGCNNGGIGPLAEKLCDFNADQGWETLIVTSRALIEGCEALIATPRALIEGCETLIVPAGERRRGLLETTLEPRPFSGPLCMLLPAGAVRPCSGSTDDALVIWRQIA